MQTFLPYEDFQETAEVLDYKRLGKQRVEVLQILNSLRFDKGWKHHPAVKMWAGHETILALYGLTICEKWIDLGYKDTCRNKIFAHLEHLPFFCDRPWWLGDERLHLSHKSNLIRKDKNHYGKLWPGVSDNLPYFWPTHNVPEHIHNI